MNNPFTAATPPLIEGDYTVQPPAPRPRRFMYDGKTFDDPGPQYSIRDVMGFLAQSYPELANGSWTKTPYDDYDLLTFYKVTGEKGNVSPSDLLKALDSIPAAPLEALSLTEQLLELERQGGLTTDTLTKMSDGIQAAQQQMRAVEKMSALILDRILHLPAVAHPRVPLGF